MDRKVKITKRSLVVRILDMIYKSGVCPDTTPTQWVAIIFDLHKKGMLYALLNPEHTDIIAAWAVYRVPAWNPIYAEMIPENEDGQIAYVPFFVSKDKKANSPLRALKCYLKENPGVNEIIYYRRNNDDDLVRRKLKYREGVHV